MDDVALLRRTVHRCTAFLVLVLGAVVESLTTGASPLAVVLIVGSALYLLVSFVLVDSPVQSRATAADGE